MSLKVELRILFVLVSSTIALAQTYDFYAEKPGSCPPPLPVTICSRSCFVDAHCQGIGKCCLTGCGGSVCSRPVTMRNPHKIEKPGSCPMVPSGPWVCSPTCSTDSDCRGSKKCCKNRCGALACQVPDIEIVESVEISYQPQPQPPQPANNDPNGFNGLNPNNPFLFHSN